MTAGWAGIAAIADEREVRALRAGAAAVLAMLLLVTPSAAQEDDPLTAARAALDEYVRAWNAGDNEAIAAVSNFPRVSVGTNGRIVVRDTPEQIAIDFRALRLVERWDHSTLDLVDTTHVSETKVHFRIVTSRRYADGRAYRTNAGLYIVTRQNGHWGLQVQSVLPPTGPEAGP